MEKVRVEDDAASKSTDRISDLPKEILHEILRLLHRDQAVQTSVLSKSWRYIWCCSPYLSFSDNNLLFNGDKQYFLSIVNNTLQRYVDQRLCIKIFCLCISLGDPDHDSILLLEKWIPRLANMGMKKFGLSIRTWYEPGHVKLPSVVFDAESLQYLEVQNFMLDQKAIPKIVPFKHLRTLCLQRVHVEDEILEKIISSCPLIEHMLLESCMGLKKINANDLYNLKDFYFSRGNTEDDWEESCPIEIHTPSIETIDITDGNILFSKGADFRNLNDLRLYDVESSWEHLSSCEFPSLKRLTLSYCDGLEEFELFIDAPNILHFKYRGHCDVPSIAFATTTSSHWDSHVRLKFVHSIDDSSSWFLKLKELLKSLSQSDISLDIRSFYISSMGYLLNDEHSELNDEDIVQKNFNFVPDINGVHILPVVVESLSLDSHASFFSSLLNGFFRICRPRIIECTSEFSYIECMWKILMERENDQFRELWLPDLEEVRIEVSDVNQNEKEWNPVTLSELHQQWMYDFTLTRFALKWKQTS